METVILKVALTVIQKRRSVRSYTGVMVSKEDIDKILRATMTAPAAIHMIPWKFIVVMGKVKLKATSGIFIGGGIAQQVFLCWRIMYSFLHSAKVDD